ncbi:hypothetical protein [Streptantibioticus silvisoli]|uniref:Uncharacterized protein n=1 Tax=Streptantibioticus silvisoli TaxID=2705255 RepID=A0ABT6W527_9ACTN|nr:hypothetical protein [Streptantibioticus silvisoli]MDI5965784.1 hypothetical protein [Streptantibioticus silvisoli]
MKKCKATTTKDGITFACGKNDGHHRASGNRNHFDYDALVSWPTVTIPAVVTR